MKKTNSMIEADTPKAHAITSENTFTNIVFYTLCAVCKPTYHRSGQQQQCLDGWIVDRLLTERVAREKEKEGHKKRIRPE